MVVSRDCTSLRRTPAPRQSAPHLFWKDLSNFLVDTLGFTVNPYDWCVSNKQINGKQCTIGWYVDDLKLSHVETDVLEDILSKLQQKWGKEAPLTVTHGKVHVYLGITIDYSVDGQVTFKMLVFHGINEGCEEQ